MCLCGAMDIKSTVPDRVYGRLRHIANTLDLAGAIQKPQPQLPSYSLPLPISNFAPAASPTPTRTSRPAPAAPPPPSGRRWVPRCSHSTMTRLYQTTYKCEICRHSGQFGWLWRCTMDRDPLIMDAKDQGYSINFDALGQFFTQQMTLGKYGADVRIQKYAFLKEITPEQLASYTPDQIAVILAQRDKLLSIISEERSRLDHPQSGYAGRKYPDDKKPWMPDKDYECQYKVCQRCYSLGKDKSWVSLNGVLNGDILPTVATGFSFTYLRFRPCANVKMVKRIGYRTVPVPRHHPANVLNAKTSKASVAKIMDIIDDHLEVAANSSTPDSSKCPPALIGSFSPVTGNWRAGRPTTTSGFYTQTRQCEVLIRPPWTPPPTPAPEFKEQFIEESRALDIKKLTSPSPASLKTNPALREQVFLSVPSLDGALAAKGYIVHRNRTNVNRAPYQSEDMCDVGLFLPFKPEDFLQACNTPLPAAGFEESLFFSERAAELDDIEEAENYLDDNPDDALDGVGLTEEAAELGVADIVTQVQQVDLGLDISG
ncbi:hypothetical protein B0T17DRAFT_628210 [Bombardia bombarda]|uniref:Uncharacterized protein n=1 Tax=Bombardia bombarda TaxID=252184 RepID=A0AA40CFZ6_9PEZI|nr:hypothetical protein B0T17DRAFT_628210 [Bombardia bombarda]